jgi:hypothetical protein
MPRIPETSERYRTKQEIVRDIAFILKAEVAFGTQYAVLKDASWVWTEFNGKYKGCERWSKRALQLVKRDPETNLLRHEHAVPRQVVFQMLRKLKKPTIKSVGRICDKFLIGVVITKEEDLRLNRKFRSTMPDEFWDTTSKNYRKPWLRYEQCKIKLVPKADD